MITLQISELGWVNDLEDEPNDPCAHGDVLFRVNQTTFVTPADGNITVSTAALYLLRTLEHDHTKAQPAAEANLLFPCCGFTAFPDGESRYGFICCGCPNGVDFEIVHTDNMVTIEASDGRKETVELSEWTSAVYRFADDVQRLYERSTEKNASEEFGEMWPLFWEEWKRRREAHPH
jgi:hypothetical protein